MLRLLSAQVRVWPRLAPRGLLSALQSRSIITVEVNQVPERLHTPGDNASKNAMSAEVARAEEVAFSQFHRLVQEEVRRKTLLPGQRGWKRFSRYLQPSLAARDKGKCAHLFARSCVYVTECCARARCRSSK